MSADQKRVIKICRRQLDVDSYPVKRVLVQGKAGTGKSALINFICKELDDRGGQDRIYEVLAPTGAAARNIEGKTIHSFLRIPINERMQRLNGESLRNFSLKLSKIKFIPIDEYSMVGVRLLNKIHMRLCEARGSSDEPFGGFCVYFFGDLRQLPPVRDIAIYMPPGDDSSALGSRLVQSLEEKIMLSTCYRQAGDSQARFRNALDSLARGTTPPEEWQLLMSRRQTIAQENMHDFRDAVHLFPTN